MAKSFTSKRLPRHIDAQPGSWTKRLTYELTPTVSMYDVLGQKISWKVKLRDQTGVVDKEDEHRHHTSRQVEYEI